MDDVDSLLRSKARSYTRIWSIIRFPTNISNKLMKVVESRWMRAAQDQYLLRILVDVHSHLELKHIQKHLPPHHHLNINKIS